MFPGKCHWKHPYAEASGAGSPPLALSGRPLGHLEALPPGVSRCRPREVDFGGSEVSSWMDSKLVFLLLGDVGFKVEWIYIWIYICWMMLDGFTLW